MLVLCLAQLFFVMRKRAPLFHACPSCNEIGAEFCEKQIRQGIQILDCMGIWTHLTLVAQAHGKKLTQLCLMKHVLRDTKCCFMFSCASWLWHFTSWHGHYRPFTVRALLQGCSQFCIRAQICDVLTDFGSELHVCNTTVRKNTAPGKLLTIAVIELLAQLLMLILLLPLLLLLHVPLGLLLPPPPPPLLPAR